MPPRTLQKIRKFTVGDNAAITSAIAVASRASWMLSLRPIRSESLPTRSPPMRSPTMSADPSSSFCNWVMGT
jgi:hypothetical protein